MMMKPKKLASEMAVEEKPMWYVPDRRLRTKKAANEAVELAEHISRHELDAPPEEQDLFVALHTCAYKVVEGGPAGKLDSSEGELWTQRWQVIREYIVEANLGLVYSMMGRFSARNIDDDDLLSDAMLALARAVDRFNPWRGYRFSTYACNVIARALMRRGRKETEYRRHFPVQHDNAFERPTYEEDVATELYKERLIRALDQNLGQLNELETMILARRFPENPESRLTFQEIGATIGLSKERVRQIQNLALDKLREVLGSDPVLK